MKDLSALVPKLQSKLPDQLIAWVSGEFIDRPKSMRTGIVGVTANEVVFYRKKMLGEESLSRDRSVVAATNTGAFGGVAGPTGKTIPEIRIEFDDGTTWRVTMIAGGDPEQLVAALSTTP